METATFISPADILSRVLPLVDDESMEFLPKGYYTQTVKDAMEAVALTTLFDERYEDSMFPAKNLSMAMPDGAFNIKNIWLFHGTECNIGTSQKVWWKRNYMTNGKGYVANNKWNNKDPFYGSNGVSNHDHTHIRERGTPNDLYYYNIVAGNIVFSESCRAFPKVMLHFNGLGVSIHDAPIIPIIFRTVIHDFVCEFILRIRMAKEKTGGWGQLWQVYDKKLNQDYTGSMDKARKLVRTMHSSQREELKEYLSRGAW